MFGKDTERAELQSMSDQSHCVTGTQYLLTQHTHCRVLMYLQIYLFIYLDCDVMSLKLCAAALCLLRAAYFSATALIFVLRLSCNNPSVCPSYFKTSAAVFKVKSRQLFEMLFFCFLEELFTNYVLKVRAVLSTLLFSLSVLSSTFRVRLC